MRLSPCLLSALAGTAALTALGCGAQPPPTATQVAAVGQPSTVPATTVPPVAAPPSTVAPAGTPGGNENTASAQLGTPEAPREDLPANPEVYAVDCGRG